MRARARWERALLRGSMGGCYMGKQCPEGAAPSLVLCHCPSCAREFNARWHIEGEEKDEAERQAKAALKAKGEEELRGHLTMKSQQVAKKKETNRYTGGGLL